MQSFSSFCSVSVSWPFWTNQTARAGVPRGLHKRDNRHPQMRVHQMLLAETAEAENRAVEQKGGGADKEG